MTRSLCIVKLTLSSDVLTVVSLACPPRYCDSASWIVLAVVALYVLHETYEGMPAAEYFSSDTLQKALILGGLLVVAGVVTVCSRRAQRSCRRIGVSSARSRFRPARSTAASISAAS